MDLQHLATWVSGAVTTAVFGYVRKVIKWAYHWIRDAWAWWRKYGAMAVVGGLIALLFLYTVVPKLDWRFRVLALPLVGIAQLCILSERLRNGAAMLCSAVHRTPA
ncbi:MAG: hypothetical protein ABSF89_09395 [Acidimicrobiales bacterium]|jgi:hypothetical protein